MDILSLKNVLLIIAFTWHYALRCGYISDDHATIEERKDIIPDSEKKPKREEYWEKVFNDGILLYYQRKLFIKLGFRHVPFVWHLFSLCLHLGNCYMLVKLLTPLYGEEIALVAVLFWGINPMLNQNVVWISGRPYLIGVFLCLLGMLNWTQPLIFIPLYILAVMTNITIAFVPILTFAIHPESWQTKIYLVSMLALAAPFILWKFNKRFTKALVLDRENFKFSWKKINTFARIILYYIWCFFVPVRMGWYHQAGFRYNKLWEKINYLTIVGFIVIVYFLIKPGIPGWWIILGLLPNSNLYATNSFLQDRYLYFGMIGLSILIAPYLLINSTILICAITFYVTRSYMYSRHLINDEEMYRENWRNHPYSDYAINNLSYFLIQQKRHEEARSIILRGIEISRLNKMLWYNLGVTWAAQGHFNSDEGKFRFLRAIDCWKMALQLEPRWAKPAEDMKKLIQILIDNKVLTIHKEDSIEGVSLEIPPISGINKIGK